MISVYMGQFTLALDAVLILHYVRRLMRCMYLWFTESPSFYMLLICGIIKLPGQYNKEETVYVCMYMLV